MDSVSRISFVIPAWNEAELVGQCVASIDASWQAVAPTNLMHEIIVVDNNSTDTTADVATAAGARIVFEPVNQIARARNAGAAAATGDWLVFIDADSELNPGLLVAVVELIQCGRYAGCGSVMRMDDIPLLARLSIWLWTCLSRLFGWAAGSFFVCRADIFREVGGFSEDLYVTEEIDLSRRIKPAARRRRLKFAVLRDHPLQTSNRKMHLYSNAELLGQFLRLARRPRGAARDRDSLDVWYDGRR